MDDLEELFFQHLSEFLVSDVSLTNLLSQTEERIADLERLIGLNTKELNEVEGKIKSCIQLFHEGAISAPEVKEQMKPMETRKNQLKKDIPSMANQITSLRQHKDSRGLLEAEGRTLAERWPTLDKAGKRNIVEAVLDRIIVRPEEVEFEFNYVPGTLV